MKLERKEVIEIISTIVLLGGGFYAFGKFNGRLDQIEKRVDNLETRVDPLRALRVGKGDLCLKLLDQQGSTGDAKRQDQLQRQWEREGCDSLPANATANVGDAVRIEQSMQNAVQNSR
jgi:hypothetical protein